MKQALNMRRVIYDLEFRYHVLKERNPKWPATLTDWLMAQGVSTSDIQAHFKGTLTWDNRT